MSDARGASVLWREGMLLCPQHLQAFSRELQARIAAGDALAAPGAFGTAAIDVDEEALVRDVFALRAGEFVFRDGTHAVIPANCAVEQREFGELFGEAELSVWLGVQALQENVPQVGDESGRYYRYAVEVDRRADENLRDSYKEIEFKRLRARLFFGDEDRSGYETLRIATLVRTGHPKAHSALSETFVAPVLLGSGSPALVAQLSELAARARSHARDLALRVPSLTRLSSVEKGADLSGLLKLQALNPCVAALEQIAGCPGVHPHQIYKELARVIGNLAVFAAERVMPELPAYDHADLDACFAPALAHVRALLEAEVAVPYDTSEFQKDDLREGFFECAIPAEWVDGGALFHVALEIERSPEETAELVAAGVKLIPPGDIDRVVQGVVPGIELEHERIGPTSFPKRDGLHFFRVVTEGRSRDAWLKVLDARQGVLLSALGALGEVRYHFYVELPG